MAFNLSSKDFQGFRDETTKFQQFVDAQNLRRTVQGVPRAGLLKPIPARLDRSPVAGPVRQVGPTPAEVTAEQARIAAEKKAAEQAAVRSDPARVAAVVPIPTPTRTVGDIGKSDPNPGLFSQRIYGANPNRSIPERMIDIPFQAGDAILDALVGGAGTVAKKGVEFFTRPGSAARTKGLATVGEAVEGTQRLTEGKAGSAFADLFFDPPPVPAPATKFSAAPLGVPPTTAVPAVATAPAATPVATAPAATPAAASAAAAVPPDIAAYVTPGLLPPGLLGAVIQAESGGDPLAVSPKGAKGILQVLDGTAGDPGFGVAPAKDNSPEERARVGVEYLEAMYNRYDTISTGLAAYNWGPGNVDAWVKAGSDPAKLPPETQNYIAKIRRLLGVPTAAPAAAAPPAATKVIRRDNRNRPLTVQKAGVSEGSTSPSEQLRTRPPEKVAEPTQKMSFVLRSQEINTAMDQLVSLRRTADLLSQANNPRFLEAVTAANAHTTTIENMITQQALDTFEISDNPNMLSQLLSQQNDRSIVIGRNSDNTWNVSVDGQLTIPSITKPVILDQQHRQASSLFNKQMRAARIADRNKRIDFLFKLKLEVTKENAAFMREQLKAMEIKVGGEGETLYMDGDGNVFILGEQENPDGSITYVKTLVPGANAGAGTPKIFKRSS